MDELVKMSAAVIGGEKVNAVDARELWKFLGSRQDFSTWIKDRLKGFIPEQDFTVHKIVDGRNRGRFTPIEYTITLDVAKHLAMLERNEQGYKVRQYFIEVEKQFRNADAVAAALLERLERRLMVHAETIVRQRQELRFLRAFAPYGEPGEISEATGNPKCRYRRGYYTSGKGKAVTALIERYDQPGLFDEVELQKLK